ncbi:low-density lipoprotein receptor-related protein 8-like isoform X2 [Parambassis ranga]|uniref:Low-density lipoprotein receptor-related protein 8-like isoform X2 n=1 Tax=Parambassis ranga TaxID=210632 RepID=A0A6P7IER9_9TELE|nr:low-density lipoprotein receptor-related protein 8-like isoform X2 [Parambassis ranga]
MGHLGGLFLRIAPLLCIPLCGAERHSLPACRQHLEFTCSDGSCISKLKVCDGHTDCRDGSDEHHCSHVRCKKDEFSCRSHLCISTHSLCNGVDDCGDGTDEASCHNCTAGFFSCGPSDACLPGNKLCDRQTDCRDQRDETWEFCGSAQVGPQTASTCAVSEFQCGDAQCIRQAWRCDDMPDCSDGSDEDNCDQNECLVNNGGCSHTCKDQPKGFLCMCPDNMRLVEDSQCEEVDMCLEDDVCDQLCLHINGSLTCVCQEGYHMNLAARVCEAKGDKAQLVFSSSKGVQWRSVTGNEENKLAPHLPGLGAITGVASNGSLYWAAPGRAGAIYRISINGKSQEVVLVLKTKGAVSGLAVDWIHQLLYWTSTQTGSVSVALGDGSAQHQLITGLDKPTAVAVDPLQGLIFWAQCGNAPKIERASLDGRDRKALVTSSIHRPVALSLDMPRQLLYWLDQELRSISRVDLEGRHRKIVVESNGYLDRAFGLSVFEGFVYWSEEVTHSICRANKHNGQNLQVLLSNITSPGSVLILHPVLQPNGSSACGHPGTVCHHECIVSLLSGGLDFSCISQEGGQNKSQQVPTIAHTVSASAMSDPMFAGILSLIMFLSILLAGMFLWWWRVEEFRPSRSLTVQSLSLKESQDPLIIIQGSNTCLVKETLLKLDLDGE